MGRKGEETEMFKMPQNKSLKLTTLGSRMASPQSEIMEVCFSSVRWNILNIMTFLSGCQVPLAILPAEHCI